MTMVGGRVEVTEPQIMAQMELALLDGTGAPLTVTVPIVLPDLQGPISRRISPIVLGKGKERSQVQVSSEIMGWG